ncbi:hypothetical protein RZO55_08630 [Clostridium boliviensis]|uniref:DUF4304 domain-containing protein n=1 Tax=Clostridium boliviensis TaxID=318465 RepID=A0ABU4GJ55_9CLOT|nr:hypothetical protein [Clostridium boliviensis]MDW2797639.1 hypothetical protein [Clostridium boliviensis]
MAKFMKKRDIIKEIIGEVLDPEGFAFGEDADSCWFIKEFKNSKGEIARQVIDFYNSRWKKKLFLNINCFSGKFCSYRISDFVPGCSDNGFMYSTILDYKQAVETYADILIKHGLDFLKKIAEPPIENDYFREEDYYRLYNEYESLTQRFITEQQIDMGCISIKEAVELFKDILSRQQGKTFDDCRELFLEMSAFYGNLIKRTYPYEWIMKDIRTHKVCKLEINFKLAPSWLVITRKSSLLVTSCIHIAWRDGIDKLDTLLI